MRKFVSEVDKEQPAHEIMCGLFRLNSGSAPLFELSRVFFVAGGDEY